MQQNTKIQPWREKSLNVPAITYADVEFLLEKCTHIKIILKNLIQREKLNIHLSVIHCLQISHLMQQKTNLVFTEGKTASKKLAKT